VEADEVDLVAAAMFSDFEQIEDAEEAGGAGELGRDVGQADGLDGIDFDVAFFHGIAAADLDAGILPDADAHGDVAAANPVAKALGEQHGREFTRRPPWRSGVRIGASISRNTAMEAR